MNILYKKLAFCTCLLILTTMYGYGQRTISGTIKDATDNEPLIGASVMVKDTSIGTISDFEGVFEFRVPESTTTLVVSYIGYQEQEIELGTGDYVDVVLNSGEVLNEVVVIGYGTVEQEDATGAIQVVNEKDFNRGAISSPQELIMGKVPGVTVTAGGGAPGSATNIRIRGGSSLSASNDPLIVIDGVPVDNGEFSGSRNALNSLNPNDIETFTVLKDASATTIYGSRASNGVILITTKKGSLTDKFRVNYSGNVSVGVANDRIDVLSADEYRDLVLSRYGEGSPQANLLGSANTNWQDEIYQTAFGQDHTLSFSGGLFDALPYRLSLGYTDREGIVKTDEFERITTSLNLNPKLFDNHLQINLNFKGSFTNNTFADTDAAISEAIRYDPTQPIRNGSEYGGYTTWLQPSGNGDPITIATTNPVARLNQRSNESNANRYLLNAQLDYRFHFLPSLRANLSLGHDYYDGSGNIDVPVDAAFEFLRNAEGELIGGRLEEYAQERKNNLLEFYLNYETDLSDKVTFDIMAGYSWQHFWRENYTAATRKGDESILLKEADYATREYYLLSFYGRANLSISDRVFITGTLRRDGTSRFSEDNRWSLFPSVAIAGKLIDNANNRGINTLKVRVGYGITGQQDISENDYYPYLARYQYGQENAAYQIGDEFITTIRPNGYDANIKWEETSTINFGIDYGFFRNRVYGSLDLYHRETKDLINFIPVPVGTNLSNYINTNIGDLENQGIEFSVNVVPIQKQHMRWDIGFNIASNRNEITKLTATDDPAYLGVLTGGIAGAVGNNIQIHSVGHPAYSFFVYEQVYDETGNPIEGLYVDRNEDGIVNSRDQYHYKKPNADYTMGFSTSFSFHNISISTGLRASVGNYVYNNMLADRANYSKMYNSAAYLENAHSETEAIGFENPRYFSDMYVQNASFFRMDHFTVGYDFGDLIGERFFVSFSVQTPFVITDYEGLDPEIFVKSDKQGIDDNFYPRPTTYSLGINLQL